MSPFVTSQHHKGRLEMTRLFRIAILTICAIVAVTLLIPFLATCLRAQPRAQSATAAPQSHLKAIKLARLYDGHKLWHQPHRHHRRHKNQNRHHRRLTNPRQRTSHRPL